MIIPAANDLLQSEKKLTIPEIRVWMHPGEGGDDYYETFLTFEDADQFIKKHKEEAERNPMIAFRGYELNLWAIQPNSK
jgi:hypothetical protein